MVEWIRTKAATLTVARSLLRQRGQPRFFGKMKSFRAFSFFFLVALTAAAAVLSMPVVATEGTNSQQDKMKACNAEAGTKNLSGDARKTFMQKCLSHESAMAEKGNSQQEKMKSCNKAASAKALKGDDRKAFMSTCLSGSAK